MRRALRGQQGRAGTRHPAHHPDGRGNHRAVGQLADAHRHIHMVINKVHIAVGQGEPDVDLGESRQKLGHHGQHMQAAEHDGGRHHQLTLGHGELPRRRALGLLHLFEDAAGGGHIGHAGIGQADLACGAHQQARAQPRFQVRHLAAECGQRDLQRTCRRRQAARLGDGHQHRHGLQSVHGHPSNYWESVNRILWIINLNGK